MFGLCSILLSLSVSLKSMNSDRWSLDELVYGTPSEGPYQTNLPSPDDIISFIREDRECQVTRIRHQEEVESENLERIMAREEVVIPLPPPPSMNHLHLISTMMMMMMMKIMKGPRVPLNPQPLQSHPFFDITLLLLPITPLDHIHETPSPPSPPQPQPPIMGHPLFYNYHDYHGSTCIWNMSYLSDFEELNGGYVAFGSNPKGGKISRKGKIRTGKLDFDDVYFVKELKFNLFSVLQMCDKKNSVLFTDIECLVLSPEFKLPDENQVLLKVPRENNTYNVNLKNIVPSGDLTCLFAKATLDESNLWHRRLGHINFKTMNKLVKGNLVRGLPTKVFENDNTCVACKKGKQHRASCSGPTWLFDIDTLTKTMNYQPVTASNQSNPSVGVQDQFDAEKAGEESDQHYVLFPVWSSGSTNLYNTDGDAAFDEKEPEFEGRKPESKVNVSPSSSAQSKKHDDKTKREAKGKSPVESLTGYRNLSAEFEDFFDNSINEDNAVGTLVPAVGQLSPNSTNTFSAAGPLNAVASPTQGKSSYDVGVEADFNNLETSITISHIPTTRVHKDHLEEGINYEEVFAPVARIEAIRLFLAYASFMGFMVYQMDVKSAFLYGTIKKEVYVCQPPGFEDPNNLDKVKKVVKALYGLHQSPRAWYETLANYLLDNGFQIGKIDQTLFIQRQKGDILLVQIYVDDIIFGSTNKDLCKAFEKLMKDKFQMSSMGELTFFLGLQVKQK
nr:putative ribonuclease H-like domain-containing protein [Tanacetum cinerariifolium]